MNLRPGESDRVFRTSAELGGPKGWWPVGNALQLDPDGFHLQLEEWAREHGSEYRFSLGPMRFIATGSAEIIGAAFRDRPDGFRRANKVREMLSEMGVDGVFNVEGDTWRRQRRMVSGALNVRHLKQFFPTLRQTTEHLLAKWSRAAESGDVVDLQADLMSFTVDVTTTLVFGTASNTLQGETSELLDDLAPIFPELARRINSAFPLWRYFRTAHVKHVASSVQRVRAWLEHAIAEARARIESDPSLAERPGNLLEAMLVERDQDGAAFSDHDVFSNCLTMLLAGEDTTANTLAWVVHFLMEEPELNAALQSDVDSVLGASALPADQATADQLSSLLPVINETMRLKPVAPVLFLEANEPTVVGDLSLEKDEALCVLTRLPAVDPVRVPNATAFDPSRWSDPGTAELFKTRGMFTPFGGGPRMCPGRRLALLEMRMVLGMMLKNFSFERVGLAEDVQEIFGFTMTPRNLRVRLKRR